MTCRPMATCGMADAIGAAAMAASRSGPAPTNRPLLAGKLADLIVDLRPLDLPEPTDLAADDPPLVAAVAAAVHDAVRLFTALPAGALVHVLRDRSPSAAAIADLSDEQVEALLRARLPAALRRPGG